MASAGVARASECGIASAVLRMLETVGLFATGNSLIKFETGARDGFERCECDERNWLVMLASVGDDASDG